MSSGRDVPEAVRAELSAMPKIMSSTDSLAGKVNRACIDLTEAVVLAPRVGETFEATVLKEATERRDAEVFVVSETVIGPCGGAPEEGSTVRVRLTLADPQARKIRFDHDR